MSKKASPASFQPRNPSDALVARLLKTGAHGLNVIDLSRRLIEAFGSMEYCRGQAPGDSNGVVSRDQSRRWRCHTQTGERHAFVAAHQ